MKIDTHWFHNEDENYIDHKISRDNVRFPSHEGEKLNSDVTITYLKDIVNVK